MLLLCVALIAGCGGPQRPPGFPTLYACVLTFQFADGSPVAGAMVSLRPENTAMDQWSISGVTDSSGVARIFTRSDFAGAPAGSYKILIRQQETFNTGALDEDGQPIIELRSLLNERYGNASTTPLTLEVPSQAVRESFTIER